MEIWKDIPGYEGIYEASNTGKIRTNANKITYNEFHGERHWKQRELKFKRNYNDSFMGYRVTLWKNGCKKDYLVHRLIASTFIENNLDSNLTVNHKDGNRANNNVNNLEWVTVSENIKKGYKDNLFFTKPITLINISNDIGVTFDSLSQASQFFGLNHGFFSGLLKLNKKSDVSTYFHFGNNTYQIILEGNQCQK